jgi:O-antigen ligase
VGNANDYSLLILAGAVCCWGAVVLSRNWLMRILMLVPVACGHYLVIKSESRTGVAVLGLIYVFFYFARFMAWRREPHKIALLTVAYIVAGIMGLMVASEELWERFATASGLIATSTAAPLTDSSTTHRFELIKTAIDIWMEHPILGVGLSGFSSAAGTDKAAHSGFGQTLSETGAVGFLLYFGVWAVVWYRLFRVRYKYVIPGDLYVVADLISAWLLAWFIGQLGGSVWATSAKVQPMIIAAGAGLCDYAMMYYPTRADLQDASLAESVLAARRAAEARPMVTPSPPLAQGASRI